MGASARATVQVDRRGAGRGFSGRLREGAEALQGGLEKGAGAFQRGVQGVWRGIVIVFWVAAVIWMRYLALYMINWSPLWMRAYLACRDSQRESDTVVEMFRHNRECFLLANRIVAESSK